MGSRKLYLFSTLILPIVGMLFFAALFSKGVPRDLPIAVCDQDQTNMSAKLTRMINAGATVEINTKISTPNKGEKLIKTGEIYAFVYIPKGFQKEIYAGKCPQVASYYNNVFLVAGGLINKDITTAVKTFATGLNYTKRVKKGESERSAKVAVNPIAIDSHILFNPYTNYFYYLASTFLPIILLMFVLLSTVYAVGIELKDATAKEWIESAGNSLWKALTGKLLPYFIVFSFLGIFMNSLLFRYFGVPQNGNAILVSYNTILLIVAYMACGIFIISMISSLRMALSLSSLYGALAFTFSGLTFPFIAMAKGTALFGNIFPFTHYLKFYIDQTLRAASFEYSWQSLLFLHIFLLLPLIGLIKLRKACTNEKYWGKH